MDRLFRFAVAHSELPRDEALQLAVRQSSINPARALGLPCPALRTGTPADLVVLDADVAVSAVMRHGQWISETISDA
jgi:N-acetylglucosamine-6-phosphate deacetylase